MDSGATFLGNSVSFGDQYRMRVASLNYTGHCLPWNYPLVSTASNLTSASSPNSTDIYSSHVLLDNSYHRTIYLAGLLF